MKRVFSLSRHKERSTSPIDASEAPTPNANTLNVPTNASRTRSASLSSSIYSRGRAGSRTASDRVSPGKSQEKYSISHLPTKRTGTIGRKVRGKSNTVSNTGAAYEYKPTPIVPAPSLRARSFSVTANLSQQSNLNLSSDHSSNLEEADVFRASSTSSAHQQSHSNGATITPYTGVRPTHSRHASRRDMSLPTSALRPRSNSERCRNSIYMPSSTKNHDQSLNPVWDVPSGTPDSLVPVLTLFSAQQSRIYQEGNFLLLEDLVGNGKPGDRSWIEVFGKLSGTELSIWNLEKKDSKPIYLNISDISITPYSSLETTDQYELERVLSFSTTLENRYYMQFMTTDTYKKWHAALRLASFEYMSLNEAYTGALLSEKGSKVLDIKTLLAENRFQIGEWVNVRFGLGGTQWLTCYVIIQPGDRITSKMSKLRRKSSISSKKKLPKFGKLLFYSSKKLNKKNLIADVNYIYSCYALYPQNSDLIDNSKLMKIDGDITLYNQKTGKNSNIQSLEMMPEEHQCVKGYETLIRCLLPIWDAFHLYGRPSKMISDKSKPGCLLFALPCLPHTEYLKVDDVVNIIDKFGTSNYYFEGWNMFEWYEEIKNVLVGKLQNGYKGDGNLTTIFNSLMLVEEPEDEIDSYPPTYKPIQSPSLPSANSETTFDQRDKSLTTTIQSDTNMKNDNLSPFKHTKMSHQRIDSLPDPSILKVDSSISSMASSIRLNQTQYYTNTNSSTSPTADNNDMIIPFPDGISAQSSTNGTERSKSPDIDRQSSIQEVIENDSNDPTNESAPNINIVSLSQESATCSLENLNSSTELITPAEPLSPALDEKKDGTTQQVILLSNDDNIKQEQLKSEVGINSNDK